MSCINSRTCRKVCIKRNSPGAMGPWDGVAGVVVCVALDVVGKDSEDIVDGSVGRK